MKQCAMRYEGHTWRHNPKLLRFESQKNTVELLPPFSSCDLRVLSEKPFSIYGEGELIGKDCVEQYVSLRALFSQHSEGVLNIEGIGPFYVSFVSLKMTAQPTDDTLEYSFVFKEKKKEKTDVTENRFVTVSQGETLWDIAFKYGKTIESIIGLNPQIRFFDELQEGEKVRVC